MGAEMKVEAGRRTAERDPERGFAVGDRVRVISSRWPGSMGKTEGVVRDYDSGFVGVEFRGLSGGRTARYYLRPSRLEHATKFKVGDRVEPTAATLDDFREAWRLEFGGPVPDSFYVTKIGPLKGGLRYIYVSDTPGGDGLHDRVGNFQLADGWDRPPVVRIEEGKFYRTRDGVKVGPMDLGRDEGDFTAPHQVDGCTRLWQGNGKHGSPPYISNQRNIDIIAEWVEPATNDNAPGDPERRFKAGDRVRLHKRSSASMNAPDGSTATVGDRGVFLGLDGDQFVDIVWDRASLSLEQNDGGYWPSDFDLISPVSEAPTTAIVAVYIDGHPAPAHRPHVHTSKESATTEAERLAKLNPGNEFGVFQLVAKRVADVTVRAV